MKPIAVVFCGTVMAGCALIPGRYTYVQYEVMPMEFEVSRIDLPALAARVEFNFEGTDTVLSEKTTQRGKPFKLTIIAALFSQEVSGATIRNLIVRQNNDTLLNVPEIKLNHISDSATGREPFTFLYMTTDDFVVDVAHEDFNIDCEVWSQDIKIVDENFSFTVEEKISRSNKYLEMFLGLQ